MEDVRDPLAAPAPIPKGGTSDVPTGAGATGTVSLKSTLDYVATTTPPAGFTGTPPQEFPNGLPKTRPARFDKTAPHTNTDLRFNGADGASRIAHSLASVAVNSDAAVADFTEPTAQPSASGSYCETSDGDHQESSLDLCLLTPTDWRVLRAARLRALLDSPHAFTSSYAREAGWSEPEWRRMFDAATWIVARETDEVIGLARSAVEAEQPSARHLESIWVVPTHRRRGVFRALLHALAETERLMGVTDLLLWVLEDNREARRTYAAVGFEPTGERQFLPDFGRFERRLRLVLGRLQNSDPTRRSFGVDDPRTKLGQRPGLEFEEIQGLTGAAHIIDGV
jgi:GNAT superfamily N-acetyltransferase